MNNFTVNKDEMLTAFGFAVAWVVGLTAGVVAGIWWFQ